MITYQDTKRGWDKAAASEERKAHIHPEGNDAALYARGGQLDVELLIKRILRIDQGVSLESKTIIEYGCGDGRMTDPLAYYFGGVYAVDFSYTMLQNLFKSEKVQPILSVDNMFGIADAADYAVSMHVFIHNNYDSGKQIMKSISDNLKPGGLALLQIPIYDVAREPESWTGVGVWTEQMLIDAAKESGLEILELNKNTGAFSYKQPGPNHFNYQIMRKTAE